MPSTRSSRSRRVGRACVAPWSAPGTTQCSATGPASGARGAAVGRRDGRDRPPPWISRSGTGSTRRDDPARLRRPQVAADAPAAAVEHPPAATNAADRQAHPVRDRDPAVRRDRLGDDADDPRPRRRRRRGAGASGSMSAAGSEPSPRTTTDAIAAIAAHRRADERDAPDPPLAEPGQRAGDVLDLVQAERRRRVLRVAVAAEVEAEDAGRPAEERAELDEVGRDRARPAVEQEDRLVRVGPPVGGAVVAGDRPRLRPAASAPRAAGRRATGAGRPRRRARRAAGPRPASSGPIRGASRSRVAPRPITSRTAAAGSAASRRRRQPADQRRLPDGRRRPRGHARST